MFIGRTKEKKEICEILNSNNLEYLLVYGLRRVGKTKLINECLNDFDCKKISYIFRDIPKQANINEFIDFIPRQFNEPYISFNNLKDCLIYLCEKAKQQKIILFIDEYSFLRRDDSGIDSYFQEIKNIYEDQANLKIIFCGSYANIMLNIIEGDAPLYGRFSYILNLMPFNYYEASLFMTNLSSEDKFKYYSCFGGIAFTLTNIDYRKSFEDNLKHLFIENNSLFEREVLTIINQEINKIPEAKYMLELIANGTNKYSDINNAFIKMGSSKNVSYLLNRLKELDLIEKVSVINEKKYRNDLYYIKDNLLDFYYLFLSKSQNERSILSPDLFYETIKDKIEHYYLPKKFENVAKQFLIKINNENKFKNPFTLIGRMIYHDKINRKNGEFDIVVKDNLGYIDFECKYLNRKINIEDYKEERNQLDTLGFNDVRIGFISKMGVDVTFSKDVLNFNLEDFYK